MVLYGRGFIYFLTLTRVARVLEKTTTKPIVRTVIVSFLVTVFVLGGGLFAYGQTLKEKIRPGVFVVDVDLGGLNESEAISALAQRFISVGEKGGSLVVRGAAHPVRLEQFGVSFSAEETV